MRAYIPGHSVVHHFGGFSIGQNKMSAFELAGGLNPNFIEFLRFV